MAPQIQPPNMQQLMSALASFPPRLSAIARAMAAPEDAFESTIRRAMGTEIPPGPNKMLAQFLESFELSALQAVPTMPGLPIPGAQIPTTFTAPETATQAPAITRVFREFG